ncbi:Rib/alpha-like domain-containing protein [Dolosigranulum pigrum]|uniref:Rib/alpha-like domain-containing protein n=1 Tax=Dolosigranulum pigrum TaxID=29394 RepID=UPI00248C1D18|nr:Rib/alpha-like domain-containing protein [Dolosigranulum pigrum]
MVGKNNKQARWSKSANTFKRYSLKKLSVGVASVVIGTGVAWASSTTVHAAEEGTEVVTGDGEKEEPVESAVPTEAPVVGGDESSSHDAVADLVNEISAAEEPASEAANAVEPRGANESSDNDYEPIPADAIEGAAETSDEEKDAGGEDKINEDRHTEEVSKEDKDNAEEKLDNAEFQGSFLRAAQPTRRRGGRGGSTGTGENSGSTTATRNAEPEEPAVEILSASKLPQNPPVFYANEQTGNAVNRETGNLTVRTTGILAGTFFPEGTKFRLKDNRFTFDKGADAQKKGGNEGQWNRTTTIGWFGPSRSGIGQTNPEKLISPGIRDKATPFTPHPNNHPYVVRDTGQVLFALGPSAVKGERINVPMVAEWKDPKTGRTHQWEFFQGIQVGDPKVANPRQKPDNEKDWVFVGETPVESKRQSGNVKIGTRSNVVGQNFGWYGQKMGDIGEWIERKNVPKFRPTLADTAEAVEPQYKDVENGGTQSAPPSFVDQDDQSKTVNKPTGSKFSLGNGAPAGAKVNADTGVVSFDKPVDEETTVPVKVTYEDGSSDTTNVVFKPAAKKTNEEVEPSYKPQTITQGEEAITDVPTFDKTATADTTESDSAPEGTTYELGENPNLPEGVTAKVDGQTGAVTITSSNNTPVGDFKVPVKVTYSDKSTDNAEVSVTVEKGTKTAEEVEPKYEKPADGSLQSNAPQFHAQGNPDEQKDKPANTKFAKGDDAPADVSYNVDPDTGVVTLEEDIPEDGITVPVKVTYEDGSTDTTNVTFTPEAPAAPKTAEEVEPKYEKPADGSLQSNAPQFHAQGNPDEQKDKPANTKFAKGDDAPADVSYNVDPDTGVVTLEEDIPEGGITVPVKVTYEDGSTDTTSVTFTPEAPTAPKTAEEVEPKWEDTNAEDGKRVVVPNTGDEIPAGSTTTATITEDPNNKGKANWTVTVDDNGDVEVTPGSDAQPGDSATVTVETTYPDGSKDSSSFKVTVPTIQSFEYDPQGQDIEVPEGSELDAADGIANKDELPEGTEFEFDGPVDTSTPGKKKAKVIVAYPDGSTDTVDVTVNVTEVPTQADNHEPKGKDIKVPEGAEPDAANGIANKDELPEGTEFEFDGPVDTSTPGKKKAKVIVAYPDGSTDAVDVIVNVTEVPTQADNHEPKGNPIFVEKNGTPNAADGIANKDELPEGTEFEFDGPVDTSTPGEKKAKVIVAYPDGSTDTVDVTVNVTDGDTPQSEIFEPQGQDIEVPEGGKPNAADGIANKDELPEGTEFEFDGPVDTSTPGKKKAKVIVAYPDGSTDTVDVTVNVTPKAPGKTTAETLEPKWNDSDAKDGGPVTVPNTGDKIPAGSKTTATITEDPNNKGKANWTVTVGEDGSVTVTPGADAQPGDSATVTVETTYPDGSKDSSSFKVTVPEKGKTTAETLEPKWNDSDAKDGGPVTVPNTGDKIPAGSTTTATITEDPNNKGKGNWTVTVGEDGSVTVTPGADAQPGDSATVTVETTYPDGSKDSSSFKVTVPAVGPTHAHGDSLVHDKPSYDLDKLGHGQTQPSRPAEDKGQGQVQDKAQTPDVDKAGLPNYVPSQSGERLPDTATGAWVLGVVGLMSTGLGSALGLKRKKEDEE